MDAAPLPPQPALSAQSKALLSRSAKQGTEQMKRAAHQAAQEFEAVFLTTYLEGMFAGIKTDPPFGGGHSETVYRSLLLGEYAKGIAANGGLGIADHVYREILAVQESIQNE